MKNILFLFMISISPIALEAQNAETIGNATINEHFVIALPIESSLFSVYSCSIAHLSIKDKNICDMLFQNLSESIATYVVDFEKQTLTISLAYTSYNQNWKIADWNHYLAQRGKKMEAYYLHISK